MVLRPRGVDVGLGGVWVAGPAEGVVARYDAVEGTPIGEPIEIGVDPADVRVGRVAVYTANFGDDTVTRVEP